MEILDMTLAAYMDMGDRRVGGLRSEEHFAVSQRVARCEESG